MKPLPVAVRVFAPASVDGVRAIGLNVGVESNTAGVCAAPPQSLLFAGAFPTQSGSAQVNSALLLSDEIAPLTPANDACVSKPHDARSCVLNGTLTWCVTSTTESILFVPQYTLKSAARTRLAVIASSLREGEL